MSASRRRRVDARREKVHVASKNCYRANLWLPRQLEVDGSGRRLHPLPVSSSVRQLPPHAVHALKTVGLVRHLGSIAEKFGVRFVVLKGAALHVLRLVRTDARPMCDLDILLAPEDAARLNDVLVSGGWTARGFPRSEDHLPQLRHPTWPALELHDQLSGLSLDGRSWVTFADVEEAGAMEPLPTAGSAAFVPTRELLAAHAIAHGFFHHGTVPIGYPLQRVFDDLRALDVLETPDEEFLAGPGRWMKRGLPPEDVLTILHLGRRLARGEEVADDAPSTPESRLLEHVHRSAKDPFYREALRLRNFHLLSGTGSNPVRTFVKTAWNVLLLSRDQVDAIYGRQKHRWGYPLRQFLRPFDLVLRVGRYSLAWLRLRARGESPPPITRTRVPRE